MCPLTALSRACVLALRSFLLGFRRQLRNMSAAKRRISVAVYLGMLILTLILAFIGAPGIIIILCIFVTVRRSCERAFTP